MPTRKRGPLKIDLSGRDGTAKIDAQFCPITGRYCVRIGKRKHNWSATEFAQHFRAWLIRQKG